MVLSIAGEGHFPMSLPGANTLSLYSCARTPGEGQALLSGDFFIVSKDTAMDWLITSDNVVLMTMINIGHQRRLGLPL
jgi:hypothetical protein